MRNPKFPNVRSRFVMAFALMALVSGVARAAEVVNSTVPFAFTAGTADLPAGQYRLTIDRDQRVVTVQDAKSGKSIVVQFVTTLSRDPRSKSGEARVVFDKGEDGKHMLSEVWSPKGDGVLVGAAKGKHEHKVIDVKE